MQHIPLHQALHDLKNFIRQRLYNYFAPAQQEKLLEQFPEWQHEALKHDVTPPETVVLLCALAAHFQPDFFDKAIQEFFPKGGDFPEFGGVKGGNTRYTLPTGDTALFLLAGTDAHKRTGFFRLFSTSHWFWKERLLWLEPVKEGEPRWSGKLVVSTELVDLLGEGRVSEPAFGPDFPAKQITTRQSWNDLVLPLSTLQHLEDLKAWLHYNDAVLQDPVLNRRIKPGYRALFFGPSGTGKTLAATLLGQEFQKPVFRIDLSQVVSKYIGETEKNLEKVFLKAEHKDWILFFDEADALFGKRSSVQNAHDRYANQEVSYLLQRVEDFAGLVILASNFKSNMDTAFLRRFNAIIEFPLPGTAERLLLWKKAMPPLFTEVGRIDLEHLAEKFALTGSSINQIIHQATLQMHAQKQETLCQELLLQGIHKELKKEDKLLR
jgi:hypothetical protein